jgi:hypothetical protein
MTLHNDRYIMALYYAHGRADAQAKAGERQSVGPTLFAEFYAAQWAQYIAGEQSFMPSVQDAWDLYRRSLHS